MNADKLLEDLQDAKEILKDFNKFKHLFSSDEAERTLAKLLKAIHSVEWLCNLQELKMFDFVSSFVNEGEALQKRSEVEYLWKFREVGATVPFINFPSHWEVQIIPPYSYADVRFRVRDKDSPKGVVSVYLDSHGVLGVENRPYWEIFLDNELGTERYLRDDVAGLLAGIEETLSEYKERKDNV